jgi:hypothetical protein
MSLLLKGGIRKLSELEIDANKDWAGKGIANLAGVATGIQMGHIVQHNGAILETLPPGISTHVLTSEGPGHKITWAPGGLYLWRYFPVEVELSFAAGLFSPSYTKELDAHLAAPCGVEDRVNPEWFRRLEPSLASIRSVGPFSADRSQAEPAPANTEVTWQLPVSGAIADDGGAQTNETPAAKSGPQLYEGYTTGEDTYKGTSTSAWEAQTFTPAMTHRLRYARLKLYRAGTPGVCTVGIRNTDISGHPTGPDLCQTTFNGNALTEGANGDWYTLWFSSPITLTAATRYAIVLRSQSGGLRWRADGSSATYAGGNREYSTNSGTTWTTDPAADFTFEEHGTLNDMTLLPATLAVNDAYYFGYKKKFYVLELDIGQAGAGTYSLAWEYWNGIGWTALVDLNDGTNAFKSSWTNEVSHTPQADWGLTNILGMNLYWIRARITATGTGYDQPLGTWADVRASM